MKLGALNPMPTTNVSADVNLDALGLVISTLSKNFLKTHINELVSVDLNTFVTKYPPGFRKSVANLKAAKTSSDCVYASLLQLAPTLGAPSFRTASHFLPFNYFLNR